MVRRAGRDGPRWSQQWPCPGKIFFVHIFVGIFLIGCEGRQQPEYSGPLASLAAAAQAAWNKPLCDTTAVSPTPRMEGLFLRCRARLDTAEVMVTTDLRGRVVEVGHLLSRPSSDIAFLAQSMIARNDQEFGPSRPWCDGRVNTVRLQWAADSFYTVLVADTVEGTITLVRTLGPSYCNS